MKSGTQNGTSRSFLKQCLCAHTCMPVLCARGTCRYAHISTLVLCAWGYLQILELQQCWATWHGERGLWSFVRATSPVNYDYSIGHSVFLFPRDIITMVPLWEAEQRQKALYGGLIVISAASSYCDRSHSSGSMWLMVPGSNPSLWGNQGSKNLKLLWSHRIQSRAESN